MNMEEIEQRRLMEFAMRQAVIEAQYEADRRIFEEQRRQVDEAMQRTTKKLLQRLGIPIISEGDFLDLIQSKKTEARKVIDERVDTEALRAYFR